MERLAQAARRGEPSSRPPSRRRVLGAALRAGRRAADATSACWRAARAAVVGLLARALDRLPGAAGSSRACCAPGDSSPTPSRSRAAGWPTRRSTTRSRGCARDRLSARSAPASLALARELLERGARAPRARATRCRSRPSAGPRCAPAPARRSRALSRATPPSGREPARADRTSSSASASTAARRARRGERRCRRSSSASGVEAARADRPGRRRRRRARRWSIDYKSGRRRRRRKWVSEGKLQVAALHARRRAAARAARPSAASTSRSRRRPARARACSTATAALRARLRAQATCASTSEVRELLDAALATARARPPPRRRRGRARGAPAHLRLRRRLQLPDDLPVRARWTPRRAAGRLLTDEQEQAVGAPLRAAAARRRRAAARPRCSSSASSGPSARTGSRPGRILAITFTERAAGELRERVRARLLELGEREAARDTEAAFVGTFHGFCARLLRAHALAAELDPAFAILDEGLAGRLRERAFRLALRRVPRRTSARAGRRSRWPPTGSTASQRDDRRRSTRELRSRGAASPAAARRPGRSTESRRGRARCARAPARSWTSCWAASPTPMRSSSSDARRGRLRRPRAARARAARTAPRSVRRGLVGALRAADGRRVPGHQPAPARRSCRRSSAATCSRSATSSSRSTASATPT